jgi:hypothetical protein
MGIKTIPAEEYVRQLLGDKEFITSDDIPLDNDFDFVMTLMITAEYDYQSSNYRLQLLDGSVCRNGYTIPNMQIRKKT